MKKTLLLLSLLLIAGSILWWSRDMEEESEIKISKKEKVQRSAKKGNSKKETPPKAEPPKPKATPKKEGSEREYTKENIKELKRKEFLSITKNAQDSLVTVQTLRKKSADEVHHMPDEIHKAGQKIALIERIHHEREEFKGEAKSFYENCADRQSVATPVRTLCLTNLMKINQSQGQKTDLDSYPKRIVQMAQQALNI